MLHIGLVIGSLQINGIFFINQEQAFEEDFKWDFIVDVKAKLKSKWQEYVKKSSEILEQGTK